MTTVNVCYVVDAPFMGGAERYVGHVIRALDRSRYRPSVLMPVSGQTDDRLQKWGDTLYSDGIDVERASMRLPFRPGDAVGILRALSSHEPHLVHVNMPGPYDGQMGLAGALARLAGARAVVVTEHLPMVRPVRKRAIVRRFGYRFVDRVLTVCRANVAYLARYHGVDPSRVVVIPNALESGYGGSNVQRSDTRNALGIEPGAVVVVFLGNLLEHKGLHRVIAALSENASPSWHLLVVGTGPEEARCRSMIAERSLQRRVTFAGAVDPGKVESLLGAADVLTLPSTIEGMPYVILEAMASSLPVVASDVFGIPEMVVDGETGWLVAPEDIPALGRSLTRLIDDAELRARFGGNARARFEAHFTMDRQRASIEAVYEDLLGQSAVRR